ncbi:hypothetical protein [Acidithiobacillus sulfuriphilus]|uniref:hypothetical protein n=1 Tax=Acidithiobacillus sulfuriphilus TaxID=1867749 RepID=UPI003F5DF328
MSEFINNECDHAPGIILNDVDVQMVSGGGYTSNAINSGLNGAAAGAVLTLGDPFGALIGFNVGIGSYELFGTFL